MRSLAILLLAGSVGCAAGRVHDADLVLRGGTVVDGSGGAPVRADVAIRDGIVVAIGAVGDVRGRRELDVSGQVVAPGFVDIHSHADLLLLADDERRQALTAAKISQGVTTIVVGNCGLGAAPTHAAAAEILAGVNGWMTPEGVTAPPMSIQDYLERLERQGVPLNVATLAAHGPIRISAMGLTPNAATHEQMQAMADAVGQALDEGALGLSVGLIYPPGMFTGTDELTRLAAVVAGHDALFAAHVRGSSDSLSAATSELIAIARASGARVHHSHLEGVGEAFWPDVSRVLAAEDAARGERVRISHDVFPYTRAATMMAAIFPPWSLEGGIEGLLRRLSDRTLRERIRAELEQTAGAPSDWHHLVRAVGWDGILVASVGPTGPRDWIGQSLEQLGRAEGREPFDVVADLMLAERGRVGQLVDEISGRDDRIDTLLAILAHPAAAVISDAEDYGRGTPHPAHAGAFARALRLNRERSLMPLEQLVRRMTSYPASIVGLADRGTLRPGAPADVVVFDPATVTDHASWSEPRRRAAGVSWVVINGVVVVDEGRYVGGQPGRVLRKRL